MPPKASSIVTDVQTAVVAWSGRKKIATFILFLLALAILLSLGTWQVRRLHWKEQLLADIAERRAAPPASLASCWPRSTHVAPPRRHRWPTSRRLAAAERTSITAP